MSDGRFFFVPSGRYYAPEARTGQPLRAGDVPTSRGASGYTEKLVEAVVGIRIVVTRLEGKWKVSQNQPEANRAGVVAGLEAQGGDEAAAMAALVAATAKEPRG